MVYKSEIDKNYKFGEAMTNILWAVDPECAGKGLGKIMNMEELRIMYFGGYKRGEYYLIH